MLKSAYLLLSSTHLPQREKIPVSVCNKRNYIRTLPCLQAMSRQHPVLVSLKPKELCYGKILTHRVCNSFTPKEFTAQEIFGTSSLHLLQLPKACYYATALF